ncbi:hypothetical protein AMECASPLE_011887 [Ameca splendens]|uniref:Uncharacterized protein n=1 Tax=Ameca splendens TaxID=208324 RepID=A0ABV0Y1E6_9TELE
MNAQLKLWLPVILGLWLDQVLHDVAAGIGPDPATAAFSLSDGNLMFEFLLGGVKINPDNNVFLLDEELASMRKGREFLSQINDGIPKHRSSMELMAGVQRSKEEREAWGGVLLQLANVTAYELRGGFLFNYT